MLDLGPICTGTGLNRTLEGPLHGVGSRTVGVYTGSDPLEFMNS